MNHLGHRLSALIDGELDDTERDRALVHLARCDLCRTEANALRTLKRRMSALGEAGTGSPADSDFTRRLMGLARPGSPFAAGAGWPGGYAGPAAMPAGRSGREVRPAWYIALGCSAVFLASVGSAAFAAGGGSPPAPRVTPPVDSFMAQYDLTTGMVPAAQPLRPLQVRGAARHQLGAGRNASLPAP
ncbi:MAG TPA: zf-HC2 domain-containing protein [Streptosporangiaceae bacterium]|jgi:anti-sigma factor RsiW